MTEPQNDAEPTASGDEDLEAVGDGTDVIATDTSDDLDDIRDDFVGEEGGTPGFKI